MLPSPSRRWRGRPCAIALFAGAACARHGLGFAVAPSWTRLFGGTQAGKLESEPTAKGAEAPTLPRLAASSSAPTALAAGFAAAALAAYRLAPGRRHARAVRVVAAARADGGAAELGEAGQSQDAPAAMKAEVPERSSTAALLLVAVCVMVGFGTPAFAEDGGGDWFSPVVNLNASIIAAFDTVVGPGLAVVLYSLLIKLVTLPLNQASLRATAILQLIAPQVKEIENRFKDDDKGKNNMLLRLYKSVGFDPASGIAFFLPVFLQLPIFISLFRAIGQLASKDATFRQPFLWIPDLSGPVAVGKPGLNWLLQSKSFDQFEPLVGWDAAGAYLIMPIVIIAAQVIPQKFGTLKAEDSFLTTFFPLFIGFSTLVSPQAVGIYWLVNSIVTTVQQQVVQQQVVAEYPGYKAILDVAAEGASEIRDTRKGEFPEQAQAVKDSVDALMPKTETIVDTPQTRAGRRAKKKKISL